MANDLTTTSDIFLKRVYNSGRWSLISFYIIVILIHFNGSFILYSSTFTAASINFRCRDYINNSLYNIQNNSCNKIHLESNQTTDCLNGFEFFSDKYFVSSSSRSHFQLICSRSHLNILAQSLVILGVFIGGFIGPIFGDYYGRQKVMLTSTFLCGIFEIFIAFSPNYIYFAIGKVILGILREISMTSGFVLAFELIPSKLQTIFGMINGIIWCLTILAIGILAFFIRDWQYLQVVGSIPSLFAPFCIIIISESPRWLISKRKIMKLELLIKWYVQKWNRINGNEFDDLLTELKTKVLLNNENQISTSKKYNILDIFRSKYISFWTFILSLTWVYCIIAIYAFNSITTLTPGNPYLNYSMSALFDAIGVITVFLLMKSSRNVTVFIFQSISSVSFIIAGFLPNDFKYFMTFLIILGKMTLNANVFFILLSSLYIYPSSFRSTGSNISGSIGKLFSIISPYFIELFKVKMWIPMTFLGIFAMLIGILNVFYPDWLNKPFPETIEDIEKLHEHVGIHWYNSK